MPRVDVVVESEVSQSSRVRQLEGMFDVPPAKVERVAWSGDVPIDERNWSIGLIVGPSGAGKSTIARELFGELVDRPIEWGAKAVIDDFDSELSMKEIAKVCGAVGFNTIPSWRRPYRVLSTGERFRVALARRLVETGDIVVVDEFTSVVDRQVAKIGSHAVQKYVRRSKKKFVAITCHYDVEEWLQPDWVLELPEMRFSWHRRRLRRDGTTERPKIECTISPVPYSAWRAFSRYHYMSAELNRYARCFGLFVGDRIASFIGVVHFPHAKVKNIKRCSRIVTLPDWQGVGLAFVLQDVIASAYKSLDFRFRQYPAHPSFIRSLDRSPKWALVKRPGLFSSRQSRGTIRGKHGGRACAVFEYVGDAMDEAAARKLVLG